MFTATVNKVQLTFTAFVRDDVVREFYLNGKRVLSAPPSKTLSELLSQPDIHSELVKHVEFLVPGASADDAFSFLTQASSQA